MKNQTRNLLLGGIACVSAIAAWSMTSLAADTEKADLEEIIVTAEKRAQNLQSVPIAVSALSGDQIAASGISTTQDIAALVPGAVFGHTSTAQLTYLRGVGQSSATPGGESPIATYLDGVYIGSPSLSIFELANVEQVAVLRGPQGTLFGRNATGGLIQVTTKRPSSTLGGSAEIGYGNFETLTGKFYLTGPIAPTLTGSVSFTERKSFDGYIRNLTTGTDLGKDESYAGQGKLLWTIGDNTEALANVIYNHYDGSSGSVFAVYPGALGRDGVTVGTTAPVTSSRTNPVTRQHNLIGSLSIDHTFDWATFKNQAAMVDFKGFSDLDQNGIAGNRNTNPASNGFPGIQAILYSKIKTFTNETQLVSPEGQDLKWVVGTFYLHERTHLFFPVKANGATLSTFDTLTKTDSYSAFAQGTKSIIDGTRLTLGLRYSKDVRDWAAVNQLRQTPATFGIPTHKTYPKMTWRVAIDHDITSEVMAYASYNRGFKAGNFNNTNLNNAPYGPEVIDAYEIGVKSEILDRRLRLNVAGFYYDYKGIQLKTLNSINSILVFNAADSKIYGLDFDVDAQVTPEFSISGGAEVLHATYSDLRNGAWALPNPVTAIPSNCAGGSTNAIKGGDTVFRCDLSGNRMVRAPKFSSNIQLKYSKELPMGRITLNLSDSYMGKFFFEPDNMLPQNPYHLVSASVAWTSPNDLYTVKVWGTNLANEKIFDEARANSNYVYVPGKPRTYGVTAGVKF